MWLIGVNYFNMQYSSAVRTSAYIKTYTYYLLKLQQYSSYPDINVFYLVCIIANETVQIPIRATTKPIPTTDRRYVLKQPLYFLLK